MKNLFFPSLILSTLAGLGIAWVDSRPNWDDTGIAAGAILLCGIFFGYLAGRKPWLIALAVSIWTPVSGILFSQNFGSLIALIPGFLDFWVLTLVTWPEKKSFDRFALLPFPIQFEINKFDR